MECTAYIKGVKCIKESTHILYAPGLNKTIEEHPLCDRCALIRQHKDYPWRIMKVKA